MELNKILQGDSFEVLKTLPSESVDCVVTSPPYWALRDYGVDGQLGLEPTFQEYITKLCDIFDEIKRVLRKDGTCFVNLGDTYSGSGVGQKDTGKASYEEKDFRKKATKTFLPNKSLCQIPSRFAIEMANRGWILRNTIIWHKKNAMPSSVLDRFTNKYEQVFFFVKSNKYYFDGDSIRIPFETDETRPDGIVRQREYDYEGKFRVENAESFGSPRARNSRKYNTKENTKNRDLEEIAREFGTRRPPGNDYERNPLGKNRGDVWTLVSEPFPEAHFATYPESLISPIISAGCPKDGVVLDIFMGAGTTAVVAKKLGRNYLGIELNPAYIEIAQKRINGVTSPLF